MRAHLLQLDSVWEDRAANLQRAAELLRRADPDRGDFVALPEMFDSGFSTNTGVTADRAGESVGWLRREAGDRGVWIQAGITQPVGEAFENVAVVVGPAGEIAGRYSKTRLFPTEAGVLREGTGPLVVPTGVSEWGGNLCPLVCYDLRFPELFRAGLRAGADWYCVGACWPRARLHHWRALLIARAIENQAIVLGVTRCGREPTVEYGGGSIAVGPKGDVLGELDDREGVLSVEMPWKDVAAWRRAFSAWRNPWSGAPVSG